MFSFGRKRARGIATRLGKTMVIAPDACRGNDLQAMTNVMESHDYVWWFQAIMGRRRSRFAVGPKVHRRLPIWSISSIHTSMLTVRQLSRVTAEGDGRLAGLILIGGVGDVHVEISDVLKAVGELGADTLAVRLTSSHTLP